MADTGVRAVLWDMDGVIVDSSIYHRRSWQEAFRQTGITFTEADFRHVFGLRNDEIIRGVLGSDTPQAQIDAIAATKEVAFRRLIRGNVTALPGAVPLLRALHTTGLHQALVSSTPVENIDLITEVLDIKGMFACVISAGDVTEGKPSPQGYLKAARRLTVAPRDCVVIEDAVAGVSAARRGGMKCIAVTNTHPRERLVQADLIVDSLEQVTPADIALLLKGATMERSLVLVKPDAMKRNLAGAIIARFQEHGLKIVAMKLLHMDTALANRHYAVHQGKPFFNSLIEYITSTPIVAVVFEGDNAIGRIRKIMGATDPKKAEPGTIRADFGVDIQNNAVHGSDSAENAAQEIRLFFRDSEICPGY